MRVRSRFLLAALLLTLCLGAAQSLAERVDLDGVTYEFLQGQARVMGFNEYAQTIVIHAMVNGAPVVFDEQVRFSNSQAHTLRFTEGVSEIAASAFSNFYEVTSIEFPGSLRSIGEDAFSWMSELRQVVLPEGIVSVAQRAFYYCDRIGSISIPSTLRAIGEDAFSSCSSLREFVVDPDNPYFCAMDGALYSKDGQTLYRFPQGKGDTFTIPEGVRFIDTGAFGTNESLRILRIPEGVEQLPEGLFDNCYALEELWLPASLQTVGDETLPSYSRLRRVEVAEGNPNLYDLDGVLFRASDQTLLVYTTGANEHYDVPPGTRAITKAAFANDEVLRSVTLPRGITVLDNSLFAGCVALESVALPITLLELREYVFVDCIALTRLALPPGLQAIGAYSFYNCRMLTTLTLPAGIADVDTDAFVATPNLTIRATPGTPGEPFIRTPETYANDGRVSDPNAPSVFFPNEQPMGIVNNSGTDDRLHLRASASKDAKSLGRYPNGTTVYPLYIREDGWWQVRVGDQEGYMLGEYLQSTDGLQSLYHASACEPKSASVPILSYPLEGAPELARIDPGEQAAIAQSVGVWYEIRTDTSYGYVPAHLVRVFYEVPQDGRQFGVVSSPKSGDRLHLRASASANAESLGRYFNGTQLVILSEQSDWYEVELADKTGYMMKQYVDKVTPESPRE